MRFEGIPHSRIGSTSVHGFAPYRNWALDYTGGISTVRSLELTFGRSTVRGGRGRSCGLDSLATVDPLALGLYGGGHGLRVKPV